jgi:anti-anti-sigma factor
MARFTKSGDDTSEEQARDSGTRSSGPRLDRNVQAELSAPPRAVAASEETGQRTTGGLTVTVVLDHPVRHLRFRGELDLVTSDNVVDLLATVVDRQASYVEVDLAGLDFIDCRGLGALLRLRAMMIDPDAIGLRNIPEQAALLLRTTGVDALFNIS